MVNLQNEGLRYDPALIWIDDADKQAKWYQQLKREWIKSRAEQRPFVNPVKAGDAALEELNAWLAMRRSDAVANSRSSSERPRRER